MIKIRTGLLVMLTVATVLITACEKTEIVPDEGERDKYLGLWKASSSGPGGDVNFNMVITASNSDPDQILMENFDALGSGTYVAGYVNGNSISIPRNLVHSDTIQGSGAYNSNNTLSFTYEVRDGQTVENRTASARR